MVLGAKLRTIMSSIIRWRKGETLRAAKMEQLTAGVVLMRSNNNEKPPSRREEGSELPESETHEREWSSQPAPAKRVSTMPVFKSHRIRFTWTHSRQGRSEIGRAHV